jgi:hypothetical protein
LNGRSVYRVDGSLTPLLGPKNDCSRFDVTP